MRTTAVHRRSIAILLAIAGSAAIARAADFAGTYRGEIKGRPSSVELTPADGGYGGAIRMGDVALPCRATADADRLSGTFTSGGASFPFTATLAGDTLMLSTGGAAYALTRPTPNPLDAAASPAQPVAGATELARTATGRTVLLPQPTATTAQAALDAALPRLAGVVGGDVTVTGRFTDTKQPDRGGASFTAAANGHPLRGVAFCGRSTAGGEDVSVAYCAADAPPAEWATLTAALPHQTVLHDHAFADGTGSIGVPDGWTCNTRSALDPIVVDGPDGQRVAIGQTFLVNGQQSTIVQVMRRTEQLRQQNERMMRQMGGRMPPAAAQPSPASQGLFFGEFEDPVAVLEHVYPQLSEYSVAHGGPPQQVDRVLATTPAVAQLPGGRAALLSMLWSTGGATPEHFRFQGRVEAAPIGTGATFYTSAGLRAHVATFDRDLPTLWAVTQSFKPNDQRINEVGQQRCQQIAEAGREQMRIQNESFRRNQQAMFERNQAFHDQQAELFDRFEQGINNQSLASHRAATDFTEMIGGYQKIVDTRTGEERSVDYYDSTGIVAGLNQQAGDQTEWVSVHMRDERYPLSR